MSSSQEDLTHVLHSPYGVQRIVVCQTIFREKVPEFNSQVTLLNKYLKIVTPSLPYAYSGITESHETPRRTFV